MSLNGIDSAELLFAGLPLRILEELRISKLF
jgi:hypothetical protein